MLDALKKTVLIVVVACLFIFLLTLGAWQSARLDWKEDLIQKIEQAKAQDTLPLSTYANDIADFPNDWLYRSMSADVRLMPDTMKLVIPRTDQGKQGAHLIVMGDVDGAANKDYDANKVILNLGFVEGDNLTLDNVKQNVSLPETISLTAHLKPFPAKGKFQPQNNFNEFFVYWIDGQTYIDHYGFEPSEFVPLLLYVEKDIVPSLKPHKLTTDLKNNHMMYAIFWFSMAFIFLGFVIFLAYRNKK